MWLLNLVFVAAVCLTCQCASVAETAVNSRNPRLGNNLRYYQTSWEHLISEVGPEPVEKSVQGALGLGLLGTENVAILVHGRASSIYDDFVKTVEFSLGSADQENLVIILVDWSFISITPYEQLLALVPFIADDLREFIVLLGGAGLDKDRLHLIGFDLGAHVVGIANRNNAFRAKKITALSPARTNWGASHRLQGNDADYVEVIHTDAVGARAFGLTEAIGGRALDIYPNGGTRQPGCANNDNACHHKRAYLLFAATLDYGGHLVALRCDSMTQVNNNRCTLPPAVSVGTLELIKIQRGLYRVNTGNIYPY